MVGFRAFREYCPFRRFKFGIKSIQMFTLNLWRAVRCTNMPCTMYTCTRTVFHRTFKKLNLHRTVIFRLYSFILPNLLKVKLNFILDMRIVTSAVLLVMGCGVNLSRYSSQINFSSNIFIAFRDPCLPVRLLPKISS